MRVIVVGTGVMGLAAARVLAERGHTVVAVDRFGVGNTAASSPGATRIWRLAHPHRFMVRNAQWVLELWRDLERRSGQQLLVEQGLVARGTWAAQALPALVAEGVAVELLDRADQERVFPALLPVDDVVIRQPEAGVVLAAESLRVQAELLTAAGGDLREGVSVTDLRDTGGGVEVQTTDGALAADVAVVTAGAWSASLLSRVGIDVELVPRLQQVAYFETPRPGSWQDWPCLIDSTVGAGYGLYALPTAGVGLKVGLDDPDRTFTPDDLSRDLDAEVTAKLERMVADVFPGLHPTAVHGEVCTWTDSADGEFVLDRSGSVVFGCGDSGQGFKFSPWFGEVLADLAEDRPLPTDVEPLRRTRLASPQGG